MKTADLSLITEESVSHNTDIFKKVMLRNGDVPNITCFSQARLIPGQTVTPHAHDDMHEIFFTQQGSGVITVDGHDYPLKPGVCVAASPGETHAIKNNGESDLLLVYFGVTEKQAISAEFWIKTLDLKPHPEGGFYRETYRSEEFVGETSCRQGSAETGIYARPFIIFLKETIFRRFTGSNRMNSGISIPARRS